MVAAATFIYKFKLEFQDLFLIIAVQLLNS